MTRKTGYFAGVASPASIGAGHEARFRRPRGYNGSMREGMRSVIVGAVVALLAAGIGAYGAVSVERSQAKDVRREAQRQERANAYGAFLDAANAYLSATYELQGQVATRCTRDQRCSVDGRAFSRAEREFQSAINRAVAYGSTTAWRAIADFVKVLPQNRTPTDYARPVDLAKLGTAYARFLGIMRREVARS
jgi:hypothetical protein